MGQCYGKGASGRTADDEGGVEGQAHRCPEAVAALAGAPPQVECCQPGAAKGCRRLGERRRGPWLRGRGSGGDQREKLLPVRSDRWKNRLHQATVARRKRPNQENQPHGLSLGDIA
uniref:Uncharacterized protein n=1 Tax=Oryza barthii TaxID=65489 RepID=A0A0D3GKT2_9ORYZ